MAGWVTGESTRKRVTVLLFLISLHLMALIPFSCSAVDISQQNLKKRLNKPAVKSIKSPDGDIIDCVHISHQPAFDHPSLKNHTIQLEPSFYPKGLFDQHKSTKSKQRSNSITQLWHLSGKCPEGTIPIRRITKEDILRASSIERFGMKEHRTIPQPGYVNPNTSQATNQGHEYAIASVRGGKYYGAKATINLWQPNTEQPSEFSLSQFWIAGGYDQDLNTIEVGWQVWPGHYGDSNTRLFIYWTRDSYRTTGCYNLINCSGFVQTNNQIAIGGTISPVSSYGGSQYDMTILVWKDSNEGKWWLKWNDYVLGYWPTFLFSYLADSASRVDWGGEIFTNSESNSQHTSTQMGSGHFSQEGFGKASYFQNIQVVDGSSIPIAPDGITTTATKPGCYDIQSGNDVDNGNYFYYGGPGRNPNCP